MLFVVAFIVLILVDKETCLANVDYSTDAILDIAKEAISWRKEAAGLSKDDELLSSELINEAGNSAIDWYAMASGRLGYAEDYLAYLAMAEENISYRYQSEEKLDKIKATEWHRIGIAMLSAGGDPTTLQEGSINLVADGSYNRGETIPLEAQGSNAFYWGLLMMDALRYEIPEDAVSGRNDIIFAILKGQQADGGFGQGNASSPDMTAMAIQALAPYYNNETRYKYIRTIDEEEFSKTVREVVDEAIEYLADIQHADGSFQNEMGGSCEDNAQVIIALCSLGIDPHIDERLGKEGFSVVDAMMNFRQADGGFAHTLDDGSSESDVMATEQVMLALAAMARNNERMRTIFDFRIELNEGIKAQLLMVDEAIEALGDEANPTEVETVYQQYLLIPGEERSYIRNYGKMAQAMEELGIVNDSESLVNFMNQNISGDGYITDFESESQVMIVEPFSEKEEAQALALPKKITIKEAHAVTILLAKLEAAPNRKDYEEIEELLKEKQAQVVILRTKLANGEEIKESVNLGIVIGIIVASVIVIVIVIIIVGKKYKGKQKEKKTWQTSHKK